MMEGTKLYLKVIGALLLIMVTGFGLGFVGDAMNWWSFKFWAPKVEQVRYDVHKKSQAYQDGMAQQLADAAEQWPTLNNTQKGSVRAVLRSRMRDFDTSNLAPDLRDFYEQSIKGNN
jgi:hypothetical protein